MEETAREGMHEKEPKNSKKYIACIRDNYVILVSALIFGAFLISSAPFYKIVILLLEFIVIVEVVKMVADFLEKRKLRLRFLIDVFIIFLIRDVIILTTYPQKKYEDILFVLFVIFVFFMFRILAIKFSPFPDKKIKRGKSNEQ